jgi:hypothetical protein
VGGMSTERKELGKIASVRIGSGGYQEAMYGVSFELSFGGCSGCGDFWGGWGPDITVTAHTKWTEADRQAQIQSAFWRLALLMQDAKVTDAAKLKGVPIEVTTENNGLKSWRILKEVL